MAPSNVNNAFRELMSQLKDWQSGAVSQDMSVNGALTVSGNTVLSANLTATGNASIGGSMTCTGAAVLSSTLAVSGNTNLAAVTCSGATVLGSTLAVTGATVLSSTLAANGNITMGNTTTNAHILNGSLTATTSSVIYLDDSVTTASAPVLSWDGDTNTGFFRPAADTIAIATGGTERVRIDSTGNLTATGSVGYPTGSGGAVTQITSKSTGVTLNTICGQITTHNASLGSSSEVSFTLTNSKIAATDVVVVCISSGATTNTYQLLVDAVAAGSCRIFLRNSSASSRSDALVINFAVIKSVAA